jgi:hypothetical protein
MKKAMDTLKSIRGFNAVRLMQKYVKKLQGESVNEAKFSKDQIVIMRTAYGTLSRMDPSSPTYKKFIKFLEKLPKNQLKQLAGANIKWVSMLAKNRIKGESVNEAPMAARAMQKQLGSELNNVSDDIIKITIKYKKTWPEVDVDGMVRAWMKGLHSRLKRSGVKI